MADRAIVETGSGFIGSPPALIAREGRLSDVTLAGLEGFLREVADTLNGGIVLGDGSPSSRAGNLSGQLIAHVFKNANAEYQIPHGLERKPIGYLVLQQDAAGSVYVSNAGGWGVRNLYLKASAPMSVLLLVM